MNVPWKMFLFAALLVTTWLFLSPSPPGADVSIPFFDKLAHLGLFLILALLARRAYPAQPAWGAFAALVFYGASIELAQGRIGRGMDVLDLAADGLGAASAFLVPRSH
jgi:VanZ family protein